MMYSKFKQNLLLCVPYPIEEHLVVQNWFVICTVSITTLALWCW